MPDVRSFVAAFVLRIVHFSLFIVFVLRLVSSSLRSFYPIQPYTEFCVVSIPHLLPPLTAVYIRIVRMPLLVHSMRWQHRDGFSSVHCFTFRTMHNKMKYLYDIQKEKRRTLAISENIQRRFSGQKRVEDETFKTTP